MPRSTPDLTGQRFGRLTVIRRQPRSEALAGSPHAYWILDAARWSDRVGWNRENLCWLHRSRKFYVVRAGLGRRLDQVFGDPIPPEEDELAA